MLARNDEIIIADNVDEIRPLASITKLIVTAMIVIDNAYSLDQKIIITKDVLIYHIVLDLKLQMYLL